MSRCYFELRAAQLDQTTDFTADVMRHLHTRQYLGKALVVHPSPTSVLRVARKQWLRLARITQKHRSSTINADKILRFTHSITHMQQMDFTIKTPLQQPDAHVYFGNPSELVVPHGCYTAYVCANIDHDNYQQLAEQLPEGALVVDYTGQVPLDAFAPKKALEDRVATEWHKVQAFCHAKQIDLDTLCHAQFTDIEALDNALDTLLGMSYDFLHVASDFQRTLELAKPIRTSKSLQVQYNLLTMLAFRVRSLTPGAEEATHLLRTYHEDETYFLHDIGAGLNGETESLEQTIHRHVAAGRENLADALLVFAEQRAMHPSYMGRSLKPNL